MASTTRTKPECVYTLELAKAATWLESPQIRLVYRREKKFQASPSRSQGKYIKYTPKSAGSEAYVCRCAGKKRSEPKNAPANPRVCLPRGCKARITIRYPHGYSPTPEGNMNIAEHGDMEVKIRWTKSHSHPCDHEFMRQLRLSSEMRQVVRDSVEAGLSWKAFDQEKKKMLLENHPQDGYMEVLKIKRHQMDYERRQKARAEAV